MRRASGLCSLTLASCSEPKRVAPSFQQRFDALRHEDTYYIWDEKLNSFVILMQRQGTAPHRKHMFVKEHEGVNASSQG